jgi:sugar porter (SP) family MFS transporter
VRFIRELWATNTRFVVRLGLIAALGGFLFGYDTGVISGALPFISKALGASKFDQQAFVGALLVGAVIGAVLSGYSADALSRRRTKIIAGVVYVLGALGSAVSQTAAELIAARLVLGLAVGTASFVAPMYISELAPKRLRGGVTSFNQLMIVSGIFLAYVVNWALKGAADNWRWMLGLGALPGLALAIGMYFQPFSPRWLIQQGDEEQARAVLRRARTGGDEEIDQEVAEIKKAAAQERGVRELWQPKIRPLVVVGLALAIAQQLIGVNTVIYYAPTILKFAGVGTGSAITQALSVGITNVIFTIVAVVLIDRVGRRPLLIVGTCGCVAALVVLGVYFADAGFKSASWLPLVCLIVYIASFAIGLGPVFWLMISEIFPLRVRSPAMAVSTVGNWTANFLVSSFFLSLTSAITKQGAFWLYAGFGVLALVYFAVRVPETKDRSLEQIERDLAPQAD